MPEIDLNDLASLGEIRDQPAYMLPPEAWSLALNMRRWDGGMERLGGWAQVFGGTLFAPHFAMPLSTSSQLFWVYVGLQNAAAYDGASHSFITRGSGPYNASETNQWNGTVLGGVMILNNGVDVPQYWPSGSLSTLLSDLLNWPATLRAAVIRAFGPYLVAFNLTDGGVSYPHAVQWSHPADPGSIPSSWAIDDPTKDGGRKDLEDVNAGIILDALPLGSEMFVYKQSSIWRMRIIGGRFVMDFKKFLETVGTLGPRCVAVTGDGLRHVVATQEDIIWHNGNSAQSILTGRWRRRLFNVIDSANGKNSFMFANPINNELWFCYPTKGSVYPNAALILGYGAGDNWTVTQADGITFRNATSGPIITSVEDTWEDNEDTWEADDVSWSDITPRRVVMSSPEASKLLLLEEGTLRDGVVFTGTLQREGLSLLGRKRSGEWIVDYQRQKLVTDLWPKVQNGPISIRVGAASVVNGTTIWNAATTFDPSTEVKANIDPISGRGIAVEYSAGVPFRVDGYKINVNPLGEY